MVILIILLFILAIIIIGLTIYNVFEYKLNTHCDKKVKKLDEDIDQLAEIYRKNIK